MSGAFGWHRGNVSNDASQATPGYFGQKSQAATPASSVIVTQINPPAVSTPRARPSLRSVATALPVPDARQAQKTTGEIVVIISLDVTGSLSSWPEEILKRLARLYQVACDYFGTDNLDVLFIAHGDARTDQNPIQVARIGRGQELEPILASFDCTCGGGGQGTESHEIVAAYLAKQLDVSSARHVYTFFVTDEAACSSIDPRLAKRELGITLETADLDTKRVFDQLRKRMSVYTVLCATRWYNDAVCKDIAAFWENLLGREHILPLDDARRVVDVMLGVFAKTTGQLDRFTKDLSQWQGGTPHGKQNVNTVLGSIALVGNPHLLAPKPQASQGTRALLPPATTGSTASKKK